MPTRIKVLLEHLHRTGGGLTDGQLLGRFVATRDEQSFAALVRRHGPMVLGVCRRVLRHEADAEDAFQATFLVLAQKAASVVKRDSLGSWLYGVAYRTAQCGRAANARRRARERPMKDLPHPEAAPTEVNDWQPLLDRELHRLPEKYRAALVLCDLEGRTRRQVARLLGVPEGTLSSRLATGRQLLAKRLVRCGLALSAGALAVAMSEGAASAQLSAALVGFTAKAAVGNLAAASPAAVALMKGMLNAMFLKKLKVVVGVVLVVGALGVVGLAYQTGTAPAAPPDKPSNELESLRKENELLKLNLLVVLEKVRAQETELNDLRGRQKGPGAGMGPGGPMGPSGGGGMRPPGMGGGPQGPMMPGGAPPMGLPGGPGGKGPDTVPGGTPPLGPPSGVGGNVPSTGGNPFGGAGQEGASEGGAPTGLGAPTAGNRTPDPVQEAEAAVKALREAKDQEAKRHATEALEKAMKKLREQMK